MRKLMMVFVLAVVVPVFFVSAQQNPLRNRGKQEMSPQVDLESEPESAPVDELDVSEFQLKRKELQGKVIELEFDNVIDLKQVGEGYSVRVTFESARVAEGMMIFLPEDGLEFFEPLSEHRGPLRATVYIEVLGNNMSRALGTRYSKNKPEGERYSWYSFVNSYLLSGGNGRTIPFFVLTDNP